MNLLEDVVAKKRNTLKTDRLDMSFGELMSMYEDQELYITPEYQRAFRWSNFQQTRFIESVLLGIPIPPIFVAEDDDGKWEVVDGLQRISTIFSFFGLLEDLPLKNNSILTQGEMIKELDGLTIETLPIKLKTTMKRSVCRIEIVKWDSQEDIRYELFNRLNTGSSPLSEQEIRNCIFRAYPIDLNQVLRDISELDVFENFISPSANKKEQMFLEELTLRFFAFKYLNDEFRTTVPQFLTEFMKDVSKGDIPFDLEKEKLQFIDLITILNEKYGKKLFRPKGNFSLHIFDSIAYALPKITTSYSEDKKTVFKLIDLLVADADYKSIGTSTFSNKRIKDRMNRALEIFQSA